MWWEISHCEQKVLNWELVKAGPQGMVMRARGCRIYGEFTFLSFLLFGL